MIAVEQEVRCAIVGATKLERANEARVVFWLIAIMRDRVKRTFQPDELLIDSKRAHSFIGEVGEDIRAGI